MIPPLDGVTILGVTEYGAGPFACTLLAGLGARIVKIEAPARGGDSGRGIPPLAVDGDSPFFQQANLGSQSVCLDLAAPAGRAAFERLVARADGLLTNLRPAAVEKLGLTYQRLRVVNPRLVACALTGFGRTGPMVNAPGYDYLYQARYGHMSLTGEPERPPMRANASFVDLTGAALAALALASALRAAERSGIGGQVDTSLMEAAVWQLMYLPAWYTAAGYVPQRTSWGAHQTVVPCRLFSTADGYVMVMTQTEAHWRKLCELIGRPDLPARPEFATIPDRRANRAELEPILEAIFAERGTAAWVELLGDHIAIGPVNPLPTALTDPQLLQSGLLQPVGHPTFADLQAVMPPFSLDGERPRLGRAPRLGEHTRTILRDAAGLSDAEIDALIAANLAREP
jgi:crotonobetainyl-CoA:carnitine CoA-transferase CaiB-like acyl-CoA transferase